MASFTFLSVWWKLLSPESSTRPYREQPAPGGHQAHVPRALPLHAVSFEPGDPAHPCLSQPGLPRQSLTSFRFLRLSLSELHRVCLRAERRANPMHHSLSNQQTHTLTDHHHDKASKSLSDRRITVLRRFPCVFREGIEIPVPSCEPAYFPQVTVWGQTGRYSDYNASKSWTLEIMWLWSKLQCRFVSLQFKSLVSFSALAHLSPGGYKVFTYYEFFLAAKWNYRITLSKWRSFCMFAVNCFLYEIQDSFDSERSLRAAVVWWSREEV